LVVVLLCDDSFCFTLSPLCSFFILVFYCSGPHLDLHSFPTRRSSDLLGCRAVQAKTDCNRSCAGRAYGRQQNQYKAGPGFILIRSEEHTSELQSRGHLVCRLLLEKKKKKKKRNIKKEQI